MIEKSRQTLECLTSMNSSYEYHGAVMTINKQSFLFFNEHKHRSKNNNNRNCLYGKPQPEAYSIVASDWTGLKEAYLYI